MNYALHYIVFIQWYTDSDGEFLPHVKFSSLTVIAKHLYDSADIFCYHVSEINTNEKLKIIIVKEYQHKSTVKGCHVYIQRNLESSRGGSSGH